jgi:hypothetical protein
MPREKFALLCRHRMLRRMQLRQNTVNCGHSSPRGFVNSPSQLFLQAMYILITGAAGSGTSSLAAAFAEATPTRLLETDDYFWRPSDPPYREKYDENERRAALLKDLRSSPSAVVAGSLIGWSEALEDAFDLVVFLYLPTAIRMARLQLREERRFGKADPAFLEWAAQYDAGTAEGRSLERHKHWLKNRTCPVLCLEGELSAEEQLQRILAVRLSLAPADRLGPASL